MQYWIFADEKFVSLKSEHEGGGLAHELRRDDWAGKKHFFFWDLNARAGYELAISDFQAGSFNPNLTSIDVRLLHKKTVPAFKYL